MNKKLSGILGIVFSILILVYFENFFNKTLLMLGININEYSLIVKTIINISIKLIMCFIIYFIYKKDFKHLRNSNNIFKMIIILILGVIGLTIIMYLFDYVVKFLADIFKVSVIKKEFYNIFDKKINIYLILKIISDYLITPFLYCSIIILSIDKFARRNDTFIVFTGLLASIIYALNLTGTLTYLIINSLSTFLLFSILATLYRKNKSIWFSIFLYSFYLIFYGLILNNINILWR